MSGDNLGFLKSRLVDDSSRSCFRFVLNCTVCRGRWEHRPIPISQQAISEGHTGDFYQTERRAALDDAAASGADYFDSCPICSRLVCKKCIVTYQELTLCQACLTQIKTRLKNRSGGVCLP